MLITCWNVDWWSLHVLTKFHSKPIKGTWSFPSWSGEFGKPPRNWDLHTTKASLIRALLTSTVYINGCEPPPSWLCTAEWFVCFSGSDVLLRNQKSMCLAVKQIFYVEDFVVVNCVAWLWSYSFPRRKKEARFTRETSRLKASIYPSTLRAKEDITFETPHVMWHLDTQKCSLTATKSPK